LYIVNGFVFKSASPGRHCDCNMNGYEALVTTRRIQEPPMSYSSVTSVEKIIHFNYLFICVSSLYIQHVHTYKHVARNINHSCTTHLYTSDYLNKLN